MAGLMLGNWLSGRLAGRLTPLQCIARGYAVMATAAIVNLAVSHALPPGVPWSVLPLFLYTTGMALTMAPLTLLALDPFAGERGLAASCQTFLHAGTNGLVAGLVAPLLWGGTEALALGMAGFAALGAGATLAWTAIARRQTG